MARKRFKPEEIFALLAEAKIIIEDWHQHCNTTRPHSALGWRAPSPESIIPLPERPVMRYQSNRTRQWGSTRAHR